MPVDFDSALHDRLPVEAIARDELLERVSASHLSTPQRPTFNSLILIHSDRGSHTVDFTEIPAKAGRLIQVRPGQVQVWKTNGSFDATVLLSQPTAMSTRTWFPGHLSYADLDADAAATAEDIVRALRLQQSRFDGDEPTTRLMVSLFGALVALFDQAHRAIEGGRLPEVYVAYRTAIETDLTFRHDVVDYAKVLNYSARTISRACQQVTGQSAKQVLTDRLVLEAKRLLTHTDSPAATISNQLGFSEPTNFTKFFTRNTGHSPSGYRALGAESAP